MRRRGFIAGLGGAVVAYPLMALAQQSIPIIGFLSSRSPAESVALVAAFRQGLREAGYIEGQNVRIAFRWAEGNYQRLPALVADLIAQPVTIIVAVGGEVTALAAKAATANIPI